MLNSSAVQSAVYSVKGRFSNCITSIDRAIRNYSVLKNYTTILGIVQLLAHIGFFALFFYTLFCALDISSALHSTFTSEQKLPQILRSRQFHCFTLLFNHFLNSSGCRFSSSGTAHSRPVFFSRSL